MPERPLRIALLIDADNAPADLIDEILTELSTLGVINIRRAYGNWTKHALNGWQARLLEFAIKPVQQFDYSRRKNATDMAMTIDALDLWYTEQPDAFGIVSSDADFTPLVMHLRAKGAAVYGFGAQQTPAPFVNACSRFLYLEALAREQAEADAQATAHVRLPASSDTKPAKAGRTPIPPGEDLAEKDNPSGLTPTPPPAVRTPLRVPPEKLRQDTCLIRLLEDAAHAVQDESGWARVGAIGTQITNKASFDARNYGYASLTKLLTVTGLFELRNTGTPHVAVRPKNWRE